MSELVWWDKRGWPTSEALRRLIRFEDLIYERFSAAPPDRSLQLHRRERYSGSQSWIQGADQLNNDDQRVVDVLQWLPWPRLCGERLVALNDNFLQVPSVEAHVYYTPAYMLHAIYLRGTEHQEVLELFLPPEDTIVLDAFSGLRHGAEAIDERWNSNIMNRAKAFKQGFSGPQREVICEFLSIIVPWEMAGGLKVNESRIAAIVEPLRRLLSHWSDDESPPLGNK